MNIRLVCAEDSGSCDHVYKGGAQDTIVRLPNGVGDVSLFAVETRLIEGASVVECRSPGSLVNGTPKTKQFPLLFLSAVLRMDPFLSSRRWPLTRGSPQSIPESESN